ncbi:lipase family protein [Amycolatopsis cihanbeyliensis]|uniref:Secretory lipase n=1 Tax=Amycolatopsis cihanbeyliensis TaxID=1128664 RepID=A0A542DDP1_AMYCI|nr:lipase family protein [Amycolatopsis cihanbeyliensis]TQJ01176.1 secretory lipase [Amycolatopsis cihanbeyliensis]
MRSRLLAVLLTPLLAAMPAVAVADTPTVDHPPWSGRLLSSERLDLTGAALPDGTGGYRMRYLSTTPRGGYAVVSGFTLLPPGSAPAGGWPVIAWDHGTTGIGDRCAPSRNPGAAYGPTLGEFLRDGYAIAATDYPGLGTPGVHPYLVSESEALATVDSVRAARRLAPELSARWFAAGHSQGGQASFATAELAGEYGDGLDFGGSIVYAPAPNMTGAVGERSLDDPVLQAFYSMMLVGLKTQHPRLSYGDYLGRRARRLLPAVHQACFNDLATRFIEAELPAEQFEPKSEAAAERLRDWFAENEIGQERADGPVFVAQGSADPIVTQPGTDMIVAESRKHGSTVEYHVYPGADHGSVLTAASADVFAWLSRH